MLAVADMKKNNYNTYFKKAGQKIVDLNDQGRGSGRQRRCEGGDPRRVGGRAGRARRARPRRHALRPGHRACPWTVRRAIKLPVSVFQKYGVLDGTWENGTSAYSKRGVATDVSPSGMRSKCIQCNRCAMCCPHAAIRPVLLTEEEKKSRFPPDSSPSPAKGLGKDAPAYCLPDAGALPTTAWAAACA